MTDYEIKAEIEHHRALMADLSPEAPARAALQLALDAFLKECDERHELRSAPVASVAAWARRTSYLPDGDREPEDSLTCDGYQERLK